MDVEQLLDRARDTITVKRVYGEPIATDGLLVIPAADVRGGAGMGEGEAPNQGHGGGGGFGVVAKPAGAFVIKEGSVRWQPAVDVNRMVVGVAAVASALAIRLAVRARRGRPDRHRGGI